jgi:LDH2 family malate/lactate/ureidoglycolate dehydrogenase
MEQRKREGIFIEDETWNVMVETARELGVAIPA